VEKTKGTPGKGWEYPWKRLREHQDRTRKIPGKTMETGARFAV